MDRPTLSAEDIARMVLRERVSTDEIADYLGIGRIHAKRRIADAVCMATQPRQIDALARWAAGYRHVTWRMVAEQFEVSRATAYRMLADLRGLIHGGVTL